MSSDNTTGTLPGRIRKKQETSQTLSRIDAEVITAKELNIDTCACDVLTSGGGGGGSSFSSDVDLNNNNIQNVNNTETSTINATSGNVIAIGGDLNMDGNNILNVSTVETTTINTGGSTTTFGTGDVTMTNAEITTVNATSNDPVLFGGDVDMQNNDIINVVNAEISTINATGGGSFTVNGNIDLQNGGRVINMLDPVNPQDAVTKNYFDTNVVNQTWKASVRAATTADLNATYAGGGQTLTANVNGALSLDGVTPFVIGERVLVKDQATATENGIYEVTDAGSGATPFILTRTSDFNESSEVVFRASTFIREGTVHIAQAWSVSSADPIVLDTDDIDWSQYSSNSVVTAGDGLYTSGGALNVGATANRTSVTADAVDISANYAGQTSITTLGTVTTGTWESVDIAVADGGTGASTAAGARTNLGVVIGSDVQAYDAGLQSIAGLVTGADDMLYTTALDIYDTTTLSAYGRSILDDANAAAARVTLNNAVTDGANVADTFDAFYGGKSGDNILIRTFDINPAIPGGLIVTQSADEIDFSFTAQIASIGALVTAADQMLYTTGVNTFATSTLTAYARTWLSNATASTLRTTWGGLLEKGDNAVPIGSKLAGDAYVFKQMNNDIMELRSITSTSTPLIITQGANDITIGTNTALQSINGLTTAADKLIYTNASNNYLTLDFTAFARTVLDDTTQQAMRNTIGSPGGLFTTINNVGTGADFFDQILAGTTTARFNSILAGDGISVANINGGEDIEISRINSAAPLVLYSVSDDSGNTTIAITTRTAIVNSTGGAGSSHNFFLGAAASPGDGTTIAVRNESNSANNITVSARAGDTIDRGSPFTITPSNSYQFIYIASQSTWYAKIWGSTT